MPGLGTGGDGLCLFVVGDAGDVPATVVISDTVIVGEALALPAALKAGLDYRGSRRATEGSDDTNANEGRAVTDGEGDVRHGAAGQKGSRGPRLKGSEERRRRISVIDADVARAIVGPASNDVAENGKVNGIDVG